MFLLTKFPHCAIEWKANHIFGYNHILGHAKFMKNIVNVKNYFLLWLYSPLLVMFCEGQVLCNTLIYSQEKWRDWRGFPRAALLYISELLVWSPKWQFFLIHGNKTEGSVKLPWFTNNSSYTRSNTIKQNRLFWWVTAPPSSCRQ